LGTNSIASACSRRSCRPSDPLIHHTVTDTVDFCPALVSLEGQFLLAFNAVNKYHFVTSERNRLVTATWQLRDQPDNVLRFQRDGVFWTIREYLQTTCTLSARTSGLLDKKRNIINIRWKANARRECT
jgi:hypothetical protein